MTPNATGRPPLRAWLDEHTALGVSAGLRVGPCVYVVSLLVHVVAGGQISSDPGPADLVFAVIVAAFAGLIAAIVLSSLLAGVALLTWIARADRFSLVTGIAASAGLTAFTMSKWLGTPGFWALAEVLVSAAITGVVVLVVGRRLPPRRTETTVDVPNTHPAHS